MRVRLLCVAAAMALILTTVPASAQVTWESCDRDCYPEYDDFAFECHLAMDYQGPGGLVGMTVGYAIGTTFIVCNGTGDTTGWTAETAGDAMYRAVGATLSTAFVLAGFPTEGPADLTQTLVAVTVGEAGDQGVLLCNFLLGAGTCYSTVPGTASDDCVDFRPQGGVVGDTLDYAEAAGDSACGAAGAAVWAGGTFVRAYGDDLAEWHESIGNHLVALRWWQEVTYGELRGNIRGTADAAGDMVGDQVDWTCMYLVGTTC